MRRDYLTFLIMKMTTYHMQAMAAIIEAWIPICPGVHGKVSLQIAEQRVRLRCQIRAGSH